MNNSIIPNAIYLGNLSFNCNEQDILRKLKNFGSIKRIKIFYQNYQNANYSTGYALVQFTNSNGRQQCLKNGKFINIKKNAIRIYDSKPLTKFNMSAFVFYSDQSITREKINDFFMKYYISEITIRTNPTLNHLGFAIIQFQYKDVFEFILPKTTNSPFQVIFPSNELIELWPTKVSNLGKQVTFTPNISIDYNKFADFEINHIYDNTLYCVNSYLACVYSTRINQLFLTNSILTRIETRIKMSGNFSIIGDYLLGKEIEITQEDAIFVFLISADLGIETLIKKTYGLVYSLMNPEMAMFIHRELGKIELSIENSPHIRYMAENITRMRSFNDFKTSSTDLISSVLYYINSHQKSINLTQEEAESLSEWLIGYINQNKNDRAKLLQFIIVSSIPKIKTINIVNDATLNINLIRRPLLKFLLKNKVKDSLSESSDDSDDDEMKEFTNNYEVVRCRKDDDNDENEDIVSSGVFKWLFNHYKENPHNIGIVTVSSNSSIHKIFEFDDDNEDFWSSTDMPNSWIKIDFKEFEIIPSSYTLKSVTSLDVTDDEVPSLASWKLEGSKDGNEWEILDERRNVNSSHAKGSYRNQYRIDKKHRCRFIKLTQIGKNNAGTFSMCIQNIEFFGELPRQRKVIDYKPGYELDGIFSFLTNELKGNPTLINRIELTSSCDPKYLMDTNWDGSWKSPNEKKSWVKIDLMLSKIDLFAYALKSNGGPGYIKSWEVSVSEDNKKWFCVDKRFLRNDYKNPYQWIKWNCLYSQKNAARYIKFTMTDISEERNNIFCLSGIELFGDLIIPK